MSLVNKLTKTFRWLRWSTVCAILFYVFFIGLILHSTTTLTRSGGGGGSGSGSVSASRNNEHQPQVPQRLSAANNVGPAVAAGAVAGPPAANGKPAADASLAATLQDMRRNTLQRAASLGRERINAPPANSNSSNNNKKSAKGRTRKTSAGVGAGAGARGEPETVILAASSVNERQILEKAFRRTDANHDAQLTIQEVGLEINRRILDHIDEAIQLNPLEFRRVDISPADGLITWEEYHRFFLKEHGMSDADIDEHNEIRHTALNRRAREDMMRDKARWSEAARTDLFSLTIDEYLSFRHPESSVSNLLELVDDLLRQFDQDGDDQLTIEEFCEVSVDDDDDLIRKALISKTVVERRAEFRRIIDKNGDGKADRGELLNYVNPKTPRYALQAAATLFSLCDENKDGKLTLDELTTNAEIILTSKLIDTANSFHTEF